MKQISMLAFQTSFLHSPAIEAAKVIYSDFLNRKKIKVLLLMEVDIVSLQTIYFDLSRLMISCAVFTYIETNGNIISLQSIHLR